MEALQNALGHGFAVAGKIGYKLFLSSILKALTIFDEEHFELAIEQDIDLLPLLMIYAPQWVQTARQFVGRMGQGAERKITLQNSLKWFDEECQKRHWRYYDTVVNLPGDVGSNPASVGAAAPNAKDAVAKVYPPPGADARRVEWWWGNMQRLIGFIFRGEVPASSKHWAVEHLKWLAQQQQEGKKSLNQLLESAMKDREGKQN